MKSVKWVLWIFILDASRASGLSFGSETTAGQNLFSEEISGRGGIGKHQDQQTNFSWNASVTSSRTTTVDSATDTGITDKTTEVDLGLGLETKEYISLDAGFDYASTPDENLVDFGPNVVLGYRHVFRQSGKGDADEFHRSVGARLIFAALNYVQTFTRTTAAGRRKTVKRPSVGTNSIRQNSVALALSSDVFSFLSVKLSQTHYSYNHDVNQFLSYLDSSRGLRNGSTGLSSTVSGLPVSETLLKLTFYFPEDWSLMMQESVAKSVVDGTLAWTAKIVGSKDIGDSWTVGLGWENDSSPMVRDNLAILNLRYYF